MAVKVKVSKDTRKYKCPFCDYRDLRHNLVNHVEDEHYDQIPEDETAAKIVFDYLNKGREAKCIICKKKAPWDESKWRYKRVCSKECSVKFTNNMRTEHIRVHGVATLLNDDEHQIKMLNNRKISGSYKFQDGGIRTYVGSYERERLEFLDLVMGFSSQDVITPGPTIEYEFNGEKHKWITDCYIVPFNLVIDDKPGGSNKNTHQAMKEYNEKQDAKESELVRIGKYNYVRLTDKNFAQLLEVLMTIKHNLTLERESGPVVFINEGVVNEEGYYSSYGTFKGIYLLTINEKNIEKYAVICPELKMISDIQNIIGTMFIKDGNVIGFICMDMQSREITSVYQHDTAEFIYGDMVNMANVCWGANSIIINKRNELVFSYHMENGWKIEQESEDYCKLTKYEKEPIQEGKVFTTRDIHHNVNKWFNGKNNILFVTGLSGSGKSTLTRDFARKYDAIHIELDWIDNNKYLKDKEDITSGEAIIKEYFETTDGWFDYEDDKDDKNYKAAYNYIITKIRQDTRVKYIVEGVHVFLGLTDISKDDSLIIKCTSPIKSSFNAAKREYNDNVKELLLNLSVSKINDIVQGVKSRRISYDTIISFTKSISEAMIEEMNGSLPPAHPHIVAYSDNGVEINGFGMTTNRLMDNTFIVNDTGNIQAVGQDYFNNKFYCLLKYYNGDGFDEKLQKIKELSLTNDVVDKSFIFDTITGGKMSMDEQVLYDDRFKQLYVSDKNDNTTYEGRLQKARSEYEKMIDMECSVSESAIELLAFPLTDDRDIRFSNKILESYDNLIIECDFNGYFVRNTKSGFRSTSVKVLSEIQDDILSIASSL